ncbi:MAG: transglutaminase domain-containing protein, partial [Planctomycetota bacterium]
MLHWSRGLPLACFLLLASLQAGDTPWRPGQKPARVAVEVPEAIRQGLKVNPLEALGELTKHLRSGADDPFHQAKAFHDWIALNLVYDYPAYRAKRPVDPRWQTTLKRGMGVCLGFSRLFAAMCELSNLECQVITGYGRGDQYNLFDETIDLESHAWNAVKVKGTWYLLDITWDRIQDEKGEKPVRYSSDYLFCPPEIFAYTHFPDTPKWFLLENPPSREAFAATPKIRPGIFFRGLSRNAEFAALSRGEATTMLRLPLTEPLSLTAALFDETGRRIQGRTFLAREQGGVGLHLSFPDAGRWETRIFYRRGDRRSGYDHGLSLGFEVEAGSALRYPELHARFHESELKLLTPLDELLPRKGRMSLRFAAPKETPYFAWLSRPDSPRKRME